MQSLPVITLRVKTSLEPFFWEGVSAARRYAAARSCPYPAVESRRAWLSGYWSARLHDDGMASVFMVLV